MTYTLTHSDAINRSKYFYSIICRKRIRTTRWRKL